MHHPQDFAVLLAFGSVAACASTVEDDGGGDRQDDVDAALAVCGPFAARVDACYASEAEPTGGMEADYYLALVGYCFSYLGQSTGGPCRNAMEEYYACIANTECEELLGDDDASADESGGDTEEPSSPCDAENERMETECGWDEDE